MGVEASLGYIVISMLSCRHLEKQDKNTTKVLLALSKGYVWASLLAQGSLCTATAELPSSLAICWSSSTHSHTSNHCLPATDTPGNREHKDSCGIWTWSFLHLGSMQWLQKEAAIFPVEKAFHARERKKKRWMSSQKGELWKLAWRERSVCFLCPWNKWVVLRSSVFSVSGCLDLS